MKAFDNANLKRPEFTVEQGGVTAVIHREIFMSIRGDQHPNQPQTKTYTNYPERFRENYPENFWS